MRSDEMIFDLDNTVDENSSVFFLSKGMQAVKLCTNKVLQFLTRDAG